jgi:pimeloyl-ACP methyl ester carboxylesterase
VTEPAPAVGRRADLDRFAANRAIRLHYLDTGPVGEDGRAPIVFVPGLTCVADDYIRALPAFGRRVVVIDLRGRGRSDTPDRGYARDDHVGDIETVLADAGIDRFHLMTFSRGTAYALPFALRNPDRVRSLSIGDYIAGEIGVAREWAPQFVHGRWRGTPVLSRIREVALTGIARDSVDRRYYDELRALGKPLLVVRSGRVNVHGHTFIDEAAQHQYRKTGPDVEIVTFEDSPHDVFRPDATRYPALVAALADRVESTVPATW